MKNCRKIPIPTNQYKYSLFLHLLECERNNPNKVCVVDTCHIADQFSETNYQPSMDGIFRFTILNYDELQMDLLDNIRVEFSGNRIYRAAGNK